MFLAFRGRIHPKFAFRVVDGNLINIRVVFGRLRSVFLCFFGLSWSHRVVHSALNKRVVQGLFVLTGISAAHRSLEERVSAVSFVALLKVFASSVVIRRRPGIRSGRFKSRLFYFRSQMDILRGWFWGRAKYTWLVIESRCRRGCRFGCCRRDSCRSRCFGCFLWAFL